MRYRGILASLAGILFPMLLSNVVKDTLRTRFANVAVIWNDTLYTSLFYPDDRFIKSCAVLRAGQILYYSLLSQSVLAGTYYRGYKLC